MSSSPRLFGLSKAEKCLKTSTDFNSYRVCVLGPQKTGASKPSKPASSKPSKPASTTVTTTTPASTTTTPSLTASSSGGSASFM